MKIINNNYDTSHSEVLKKYFEQSEMVFIASPFLMSNFDDFFCGLNLNKLKEIILLTTLKENDIDQIKKIKSFKNILSLLELKNINFRLMINNKLHGKVYLFKKDNKIFVGILTSANFTENGLVKNNEYGVEIVNKDQLDELFSMVFNSIVNKELLIDDIKGIINKCDQFLIKNKLSENENKIELNLLDGIKSNTKTFSKGNYWLKPIGVIDSPIDNGEKFNSLFQRLEFSKKRPSGIKTGDIIIAYGVGTRKVLSVYENTSLEPEYVADEELEDEEWRERWPWSIKGKNLSPKYGGEWWIHDLYIIGLENKFLSNFPEKA